MDPNHLKHLNYDELHEGRLRLYQAEGVAFMAAAKRTLCADPPGAGKTVMAAGLLAQLAEDGVVTPTFPAVVLTHRVQLAVQTAAELSRFLTGLNVVGLADHPGMGTRATAHQRDMALNQPAHVKVLTYDQWRTRRKLWSGRAPSVAILDEVQALKGAKTTYAAVRAMLDMAPLARVHLFTATPYENDPIEMWNLYRLLGSAVLLPDRRTFEAAYVEWIDWAPGKRSPRGWASQQAVDHFRYLIGPVTLRRDEAVLDLPRPRLAREEVWAPLSPAQAGAMVEADGLDGLSRHHARERVLTGKVAGPSVRALTAVELAQALLADDPKAKLLVIGESLAELDTMAQALTARGIGWAQMRGETTDRATVVEDFRGNPDVPVLLGSTVVQVGMNLQVCRYLISVGLPDTWSTVEQREGRIVRPGSPYGEVTHYIVLGECQHDREAVARVHRKRTNAAAVLSTA